MAIARVVDEAPSSNVRATVLPVPGAELVVDGERGQPGPGGMVVGCARDEIPADVPVPVDGGDEEVAPPIALEAPVDGPGDGAPVGEVDVHAAVTRAAISAAAVLVRLALVTSAP